MKRIIVSSNLSRYVGGRMQNWTANLLVYGAEASEDYDFEESFSGSLSECITKLNEFQDVIDENNIDGYLTLESDSSQYYEGDLDTIYADLEADGYV